MERFPVNEDFGGLIAYFRGSYVGILNPMGDGGKGKEGGLISWILVVIYEYI